MKRNIATLLITAVFAVGLLFTTPVHAETVNMEETMESVLEASGAKMIDIKSFSETLLRETSTAYPSKYDPRTTGMVTSVKNQGQEGLCWDYAIQAAAESYLIKKGWENNTIDLSELYYLYDLTIGLNNNREEFISLRTSGNSFSSALASVRNKAHFALESDYPMSDISDDYETDTSNYKYTLNRVYYLRNYTKTDENIRFVKYMINTFGGAVYDFPTYNMNGGAYVQPWMTYTYGSNTTDNTYYYQYASSLTHAVEIVGWDDNYSASNFKETPPGDGAWLIKNSWGTGSMFGTGYMWISYYNDINKPTVYAMTLLPKGTEPTYINKTYTPKVKETIDISDDYVDAYNIRAEGNQSIILSKTTTYKSNTFIKERKEVIDQYGNILGYATFIVKPKDTKLTMSADMTEKLTQYQLKNLNQSKQNYLTVTLDGVNVKASSYVTYTSSNPAVVSVSSSGYLTYNGFGDAVVTATFKDADITDGKEITGSCKFSFKQTCSSLTIDDMEYTWMNLNKGNVKQLSVTTVPSGIGVTYTSSNPSVATVSNTGLISAVGAGQTVITIADEDNLQTKQITIYVRESTVITPDPTPGPVTPQPNPPQSPEIQNPPQSQDTVATDASSGAEDAIVDISKGGVSYQLNTKTKTATVTYISTSKKSVTLNTVSYNGKTYKVTKIAEYALGSKKKVSTITLGNNVKTIGANAFKGNKNVKKVVIGTNVTSIGKNAFYGCSKLQTVTIKSKKVKSIGKNAFKNVSKKAVVDAPKGKEKAYKKMINNKKVKVK